MYIADSWFPLIVLNSILYIIHFLQYSLHNFRFICMEVKWLLGRMRKERIYFLWVPRYFRFTLVYELLWAPKWVRSEIMCYVLCRLYSSLQHLFVEGFQYCFRKYVLKNVRSFCFLLLFLNGVVNEMLFFCKCSTLTLVHFPHMDLSDKGSGKLMLIHLLYHHILLLLLTLTSS